MNSTSERPVPTLSAWRVAGVWGAGVFVAALAVWGTVLCCDLARAPVSGTRPHDYAVAVANVLDCQDVALREARRGQQSYFAAHSGCLAPDVWQNPKVLANLKRMVEQGVKVKLIAGRAGSEGQLHPEGMLKWIEEFEAKLVQLGIDPKILDIREREMLSHSVVAGSARSARGYICPPEKLDSYPSLYYAVRDEEL